MTQDPLRKRELAAGLVAGHVQLFLQAPSPEVRDAARKRKVALAEARAGLPPLFVAALDSAEHVTLTSVGNGWAEVWVFPRWHDDEVHKVRSNRGLERWVELLALLPSAVSAASHVHSFVDGTVVMRIEMVTDQFLPEEPAAILEWQRINEQLNAELLEKIARWW